MGKSKELPAADHNVGAEKLPSYLAKNHAQKYIKVGKKNGLSVSGKMNDVQLAALMHDTGIKDWQGIRMLQHLRVNLNADISCAFMETTKFREDHVKPRTKTFHHRFEDGKLEWIECEYHPITQLLPQMVNQ